MAIQDDFGIDYVNKIVSHDSGTTVYSVNAFYTWLQDTFDELAQMDDDIPMSAQTPTSYTMINGWYMEEECSKYLDGGAIQTSGYLDEIRTLVCGSPSWVNFVAGDIGKVVTGGTTGDTGVLVDYDNAAYKLWIRMDDAGDLFDDAAETYTVAAGTGSALSTAISKTGEHVFANPYTLGSLNSSNGAPQLYIFQNGEKLANSGWFSTGHFDILVKVTESGVDIDSKKITVFDRNWEDTYSHFNITLTTAGQNAVPLGNADDLNVTSTEANVQAIADTNIDGDLGTGVDIVVSLAGYSYDIGDGAGSQTYDVQIDCNGQTLDKVFEVCMWATREGATTELDTGIQGQEYVSANPGTYPEVVAGPLGTFAGGKFFGARGVYFINLHADDAQNFQLVDAAGTTRNPPNYQAFTVNGVVSGDRVSVFKSTGASSTVVDKAQYTSHATNNGTGNTTYEVQEAIPTDTPAAGTIIIRNTTTGVEEAIAYTSWTGSIFTLGSAHAGGYDGTDTAYVPYIYEQAAGTSVSETTTIYTVDRNVVARVRIKGILPFQTTGTFNATGYTAAAIRTSDSIVA